MRQYEFAIRIAQIHHLVEERKYKKALAVIRTLDMKQVKNISDLTIIADVFARTEQFDSAKEAYLKIYTKSKTRRVVYRLIIISIHTKELDDAEKYYNEFVRMGPDTRDTIVLRYRIDKAAGVHIGKLVETLEELKEEEYIEEWAYELARLYYKAGRFEECRRECEDILLWFGHGEIVERAKKLMEYVDDKEAMPYIDDRDYTIERNEPNPDDTGSLPDLREYISNMQREEENRKKHLKDRKTKEQAERKKEQAEDKQKEKEIAVTKEPRSKNTENEKDMQNQDGFIDDYEEDDFEIDAGFGKLAQKLTGFLHFGSKKDKKSEEEDAEQNSYSKKDLFNENSKMPDSKDGYIIEDSGKENLDIKIRINQDLYNKTLAEARKQENKEEDKPLDNEETLNETGMDSITAEVEDEEQDHVPDVKEAGTDVKQTEPIYFQAGLGITQDLSREVSAIYEAEHKEQLKEKEVKIVSSRRPLKRDATKVIERMTKAVKSDENKNLHSVGHEEAEENGNMAEITEENTVVVDGMPETAEEAVNLAEEEQENTEQESSILNSVIPEIEDNSILVSKEEIELAEIEAKRAHEEALVKAEEARAIVEEARRKAEEAERMLAEIEKKHASNIVQHEENSSLEENGTEEEVQEETAVQEDASMAAEEERLSDDDLPTTRALHTSFSDILTLIGGEPDPSHFVFAGNTFDLITGLSKRIVKVMKATGYMSIGRIARISAKTLNKMDLSEFKSQLKGNCLLIDEAADLMIPTIASIFEIMDEYYGDFVVILADNGNTLDQLFKFAPTLAKRFKYIIDISGYTEEDCQ